MSKTPALCVGNRRRLARLLATSQMASQFYFLVKFKINVPCQTRGDWHDFLAASQMAGKALEVTLFVFPMFFLRFSVYLFVIHLAN